MGGSWLDEESGQGLHLCDLETSFLSDIPGFLTETFLDGLASAATDGPQNPLEQYVGRPIEFFSEVFGVELWGKQREILAKLLGGVDDPDIPPEGWQEVWVSAGHGVGKTFFAALLVEYWFSVLGFPVLTTAPTTHQVKHLLWAQGIRTNRIHARQPLPGRVLETAIKTDRPDWEARGFSTDKPERAQGVHLNNLLIVVDEGAGVLSAIFDALKGYFTNPGVKMLVIGNPNANRTNEFYKAFHERGGRVGQVYIDCHDCPYVSQRWIDERRAEWGEDSVKYITKVLGRFPSDASDKCVPMDWIQEAKELWYHPEVAARRTGWFSTLALDVAREGKDKCALTGMDGQSVRLLKYWNQTNTNVTAGEVLRFILQLKRPPKRLVVDANAVGGGTVDALLLLWPKHAKALQGCELLALDWNSSASKPMEYERKIDELYWRFRERLNPTIPLLDRVALPPDEELREHGTTFQQFASQLNARRYEVNEKGRIKVESKKKLAKRNVPSPDMGDSSVALLHISDTAPVGFWIA